MRIFLVFGWLIIRLLLLTTSSSAEETEIEKLLDLLKGKDLITSEEAEGLGADLAIKEQKEKDEKKWFEVFTGRPITISGYTQVRYRNYEEGGKDDSFDIRRARLDIKGGITKKFDYRTQIEFGGSNGTVLLDATIGYKVIDSYLKITGGQFNVPFSQENLAWNPRLETINRSQVVEALVARSQDVIGNHIGRDIGVQASGNFFPRGDRYLLSYAVGVFNGNGINRDDNNEKKDFVGRVVFSPLKGLSIGANYYNGEANLNDKDQNRDRVGADFTYLYKALSLRGEYIYGEDDETNKDGWYLQAGYFAIPEKLQGVVKFDTFDPDTDISDDETDVYTIGANYYINKYSFIQLNYELKDEHGGNEKDNNVFTAQFTLQF